MEHSIHQEDLKALLNHGGFNISLAVQSTHDLIAWLRYVQVIKNMLTKAQDFGQDPHLVMLEAKNIPVDGLVTLAQLMCRGTFRSVLLYKQEKLEIIARTADESYIEQRQKNQQNQVTY